MKLTGRWVPITTYCQNVDISLTERRNKGHFKSVDYRGEISKAIKKRNSHLSAVEYKTINKKKQTTIKRTEH